MVQIRWKLSALPRTVRDAVRWQWRKVNISMKSLFYNHFMDQGYIADVCMEPMFWFVDNFTKFLGPFFVACVCGLTASVVAIAYWIGLPYWWNKSPWVTVLLMIIGHWLLVNITFHYYMAAKTHPGYPPEGALIPEAVSICKKCIAPKPPRTHHCSVCNKCILKMDHHCPWLNNCIGHYNHRYFFLYMVYMCLGVLFLIIFGFQLAYNEVWLGVEEIDEDDESLIEGHPVHFNNSVLIPVPYTGVQMRQMIVGLEQWPERKIKLEEEAISEILVADTDSESGAEASEFEDCFEEEEEEEEQQQQASAEVEPQAATNGGLPTWGLPQGRNSNIHPFVGSTKGLRKSEAPHINKDSSPLSVLLFFTEIFHLLVEQTNIYYQQHLDRQARPSRRLPDITLPDMVTFIALALQMGHTLKDTLLDYWSRLRQLHNLFYGETMTRDRFLHILHFLHFADNSQRPDEGEECDRLWKLRTVFDKLNEAYTKFYNLLVHLAVDKIIVKCKGRIIFRQYIPKKRKHFSIKIYKLCDESGYAYDMRVYLGRDSHSTTDDMTARHANVRHVTSRVEGLGHKIFVDNFLSSPRLFDDLDRRKINSCGTVRPNREDMPRNLGPKELKLRRGDIRVRTRGGLACISLEGQMRSLHAD